MGVELGAPLRASIVAAAALSVKMMYVKMERSADHSDAMTCYIGAVSALVGVRVRDSDDGLKA